MAMNYSSFVNSLVNLSGAGSATQPNFVIELPNAIDYAEQRIYRELDLIETITTDSTQACVALTRTVNVPSAFITVTGVNLITPAGTVAPNSGARNPLSPVSQAWLNFVYPSNVGAALPVKYHWFTQAGDLNAMGYIVLGPWPDAVYQVEYEGTQRPAPISAANPTTFLATYLPDLFLTAAMIHLCAYQKNWSALGDDPQSGATWEKQFQVLMHSASKEELRKRYRNSAAMPPPGADEAPQPPGTP